MKAEYIPLRAGGRVQCTLYSDGEEGEPYVLAAVPEEPEALDDLLRLLEAARQTVWARIRPDDAERRAVVNVCEALQLLPTLLDEPTRFVQVFLDAVGNLALVLGSGTPMVGPSDD